MPSWADLENELSAAVDQQFGEVFEFRPMRAAPNVRAASDLTRTGGAIVGVFSDRTKNGPAAGAGRGGPGVTVAQPWVSVELAQFASGAGPRRQDQILRVATRELYEVADVEPDGQGRARLVLKHLKREPA